VANVSFYLLGQKGYQTLKKIVNIYQPIIKNVVIANDPNIQHDFHEEILDICLKNSIPTLFKNEIQNFEDVGDFSIAIGWRWLIRNSKSKLIVFHDALLPKYRGFNPLVTALINGDTKIGVTALFEGETYDSGDIIGQKSINITYPITIQNAIDLVSNLYGDLCLEILSYIANNKPIPSQKQNEEIASYSLWRNDDDYRIIWSKDSETIKRMIDAVGYPYLGALSETHTGEKVRILKAEIYPDKNIALREQQIGKVIFMENNQPIIVCGKGLLKITEMKTLDNKTFELKNFRTRFL